MSNQSRSKEALREPGPLLHETPDGYRIHETGYGTLAPAEFVDVWKDGEFVIQSGLVIRSLIKELRGVDA